MGKRGAQPWEPPSLKDKEGREHGGWVRFDELLASQATKPRMKIHCLHHETTIKKRAEEWNAKYGTSAEVLQYLEELKL